MSLTSRHFGDISAQRMGSGQIVTEVATAAHGTVSVSLSVAHPSQVRQEHLDQSDAAVDYFEQLDQRVLDTIGVTLADDQSLVAEVFAAYRAARPGENVEPADFVRALRLQSAVITPDGGASQPDRVRVTYLISANFVERQFDAIVREGAGLVFEETKTADGVPGASISYR